MREFSAFSVDCTTLPPPMENKVYGSATSSSSKSSATSLHQVIFTVRLEPKGGLLGITLAGSEDISKPITISGIVEGKCYIRKPLIIVLNPG